MKKRDLLANIGRGAVVQAIEHIDPEGADILPGTYGVVFEVAEYHEPNTGPMVRWFVHANSRTYTPVCNVYKGQVKQIRHGKLDR